MPQRTERILTTHVGSLVRPPRLRALLERRTDGTLTDAEDFDACLRESVATVVREQVDAGVDIVSDGEYGKAILWNAYLNERLVGVERTSAPPAAFPQSNDA